MEPQAWNEDDDSSSEIAKDGQIHMKHLYQDGFRTGVAKGQEESVQSGFNIGYSESIVKGRDWGVCQGAVATYGALKSQFQNLQLTQKCDELSEQVKGVTLHDAYASTYNSLVTKKLEEFRESGDHQVVPELLNETRSTEALMSTIDSVHTGFKTIMSEQGINNEPPM